MISPPPQIISWSKQKISRGGEGKEELGVITLVVAVEGEAVVFYAEMPAA